MSKAIKSLLALCICSFLAVTLAGCAGSQAETSTIEDVPSDTPIDTPTISPIQTPTPTEIPTEPPPMFVEHPVDMLFDRVSGLYIFDIDGDGNKDIIGAAMNDKEIAWWRNDGGNPIIWEKQVIDSGLVGAAYVYADDVDGDSDGDIVAGAGSEIFWWRNDGGNPVTWIKITVLENLSESHSGVFADIDQDGDFDILGSSAAQNRLFWLENINPSGDGQDWIEHAISDDFPYVQMNTTADLDNDGDLDVLATSLNSDAIAWWRNDGGTPISWTMNMIDDDFPFAHWVYVCDIDQDGHMDVLGAAWRGGYRGQSLAWWRNEGGEQVTFTKQVIAESFKGALTIHADDLDMDGDMDVLGTSNDLHEVAWWRNDGGDPIVWTKQLIKKYFIGAWPVFTGDLDNDGDIDVVAGSDKSNLIYWWENLTIDSNP